MRKDCTYCIWEKKGVCTRTGQVIYKPVRMTDCKYSTGEVKK